MVDNLSSPTSPTPVVDKQYRRVLWHCRRGMLELDILLNRFARQVYPELEADKQRQFERLLEYNDTQLASWLLHKEPPVDRVLADLIHLIVNPERRDQPITTDSQM